MKIRAIPGGDAIDPIMWIVLRHVDPPGDNIGGADPIDAAAFGHLGGRLDQASARVDPITGVDVIGIGAICQGNTKASTRRNWRKASPSRARPTPHHPPSREGNYRIRAWSDCGKSAQVHDFKAAPRLPEDP